MRNNSGWIKLHRSTLDNPVVMKSAAHFAVWCLLLLMANNVPSSVLFNGKKIELKPGQLITGRKEIKNALKDLSESKIERVLNDFEAEQQIEQQKSNKGRLVSLLNWSTYQKSEQQSEQQVNNGFRGLTSVHSRKNLKSEQQSEQQNCSKNGINTRENEVEFEEVNSTLNNNRTTSEQQVNNNRTLNKNIKKDKNVRSLSSEKISEAQRVLELFNSICVGLPKAIKLTDARAEAILDALADGVDFEKVFRSVQDSDFLKGKKTGWGGCNLDWILKPDNLLKIREGAYLDNKDTEQEERRASYDIATFESKSLFTD